MSQPSIRVIEIIAKSDPYLFEHVIWDDGLEIVGMTDTNPLNARIQNESIVAIASVLTENVYDPLDFSPRQLRINKLAERNGFILAMKEGLDQQSGTEIDPIKGQLNHPQKEPAPPQQNQDSPEKSDEEAAAELMQ